MQRLATTESKDVVDDDGEKIPILTSSGFSVERPEEPAAISAISDAKMKAKQSLRKRPKKNITAADALDYFITTVKGKSRSDNSNKKTKPPQGNSKASQAKRKGEYNALGEIVDEFGELPNIQKIKKQQEAELSRYNSINRRIKRDIDAPTKGKTKLIAAESLTIKKSFRPVTSTGSNLTTSYRKVNPRIINSRDKDETRFTPSGKGIEAAKDRKIGDRVHQGCITLKMEDTQLNNTTKAPALNKKRTHLKLILRQGNPLGTVQKYDPIGQLTRTASPSGLIRRNKNAAGSIVGNGGVFKNLKHVFC